MKTLKEENTVEVERLRSKLLEKEAELDSRPPMSMVQGRRTSERKIDGTAQSPEGPCANRRG